MQNPNDLFGHRENAGKKSVENCGCVKNLKLLKFMGFAFTFHHFLRNQTGY